MGERMCSIVFIFASRLFNRLKRRRGSSLHIPSDQDLADVLFLLYNEKIVSPAGESRMLMGYSAQTAFENVRIKMGISGEDLIRMIGILNARGIVDAKIAHEPGLVECQHIKLGFSALSFVQETASRRRRFWVNSVIVPIVLAFATAYFTAALSQSPADDYPNHRSEQRHDHYEAAVPVPSVNASEVR